jgi:hypothetical protein
MRIQSWWNAFLYRLIGLVMDHELTVNQLLIDHLAIGGRWWLVLRRYRTNHRLQFFCSSYCRASGTFFACDFPYKVAG